MTDDPKPGARNVTTAPDERFRATKEEVIARLTEAHVALIGAADAMARRYGSSAQATQLCGAAKLITDDWIPDIQAEKS